MTRDEILVEIGKVIRVCRGAPRFDLATRDSLTAQLSACQSDSARATLRDQIGTLLGVSLASVAPTWLNVQTIIFSFQENCGQDFNSIISTYPFDGLPRDVACPKCGTMQHFQSPLAG